MNKDGKDEQKLQVASKLGSINLEERLAVSLKAQVNSKFDEMYNDILNQAEKDDESDDEDKKDDVSDEEDDDDANHFNAMFLEMAQDE